MNTVSYTNVKHYNFADCNKTSNGEYDQNPTKMSYNGANCCTIPTPVPKSETKNYCFCNDNSLPNYENKNNCQKPTYNHLAQPSTKAKVEPKNYCFCDNNFIPHTYESTLNNSQKKQNTSSINTENSWNKIPYPNTNFTSIGETPSCGYWPLYYFKRTSANTFIDLNEKTVNFSIKSPDCLDDFSGKQLSDVISISSKLTDIEKTIATYWGAGVPQNQFTPILQNLINAYKVPVVPASRMCSILFNALNDAMVLCWYYKFIYNIPRPIQYAPYFKPYLNTPQHPSYPAGHSVAAGCFAVIGSFFFPKEKEKIYKLCNECSVSRLFAGVHYPLDLKEGFSLGEDIASKILDMITNASDQHCSNINLIYNDFKDAKIETINYNQTFNI